MSNRSATRPLRRQRGIGNGLRPYVNYGFPRSTAECSAVSLCRRRYGRRYRRRGRRLPIIIDRARRIYLEQVSKIWVLSADSDHPSRSSRRRRHCRPSWVVGNDGSSVFPMLLIVGVKRNKGLHQRNIRQASSSVGAGTVLRLVLVPIDTQISGRNSGSRSQTSR